MIKYNSNTINDWYYNSSDIIKVYHNGAVCYYKLAENGSYKVCFAVVDDITQYHETEFEDVFDKATEKWYKLNNLNQYEEYGVYASGRTSCESSSSRLPQGYTEVEYIENTSSAYINTNLVLLENIGDSFEIKVKTYFTPYGSDFEYLFGTEQTSAPYTGIQLRYYQRNLQYNSDSNVVWTHIDNGDGTSGVTASCSSINATNGGNPLTLFCGLWSTGPWRNGRGKIYSFKVTKNDTLVRDLVPCKRDSDDKYGLYDLVTDTFYLSPNNVDFVGGEPIAPTDCVTTYEGKLTIDDGYEYIYSGNSWVNVGEVSGSSKSSGFTSSDIGESGATSGFSDGDYVIISYKNNNSSTTPSCMMSYKNDGTYDRVNNFSGHTSSNTLTPNTIIDAAVWKFEGTATADTYYIKNVENGLYWGYQDTSTSRSFYLVDDSQKAPILIDDYDGYIGLIEKKYLATSYFGGYGLNQLYGYTYQLGWLNSGTTSEANFYTTDGNALYALYKVNGGTTEYPKYYSEKSEPLDDLTFNTLEEAQTYAYNNCVYDGMKATIGTDRYYFDSTDENGWVKILEYYTVEDVTPNQASGWTISGSSTYNPDSSYYDDFDLETTSTSYETKIAKVTIYGYDHFTYYLRSYHGYYSPYAYVMATNVDEVSAPPSTMSYNSSSAITNTYYWSKSPKSAVNLSNYRRVTYNNLDKTVEHTFYVYFYGRTYSSYVGNATILIPKEQTNENWEQVTFSASSNVALYQKYLYIDGNSSTSGGTEYWHYRWIVGLPSGSHSSYTSYKNYECCPDVTSSTFTSVEGNSRLVEYTYDNTTNKNLQFRLVDESGNTINTGDTVYYNMTYYNSCGVSSSSSNVTFPRSLSVKVGGRFRFANSSNRHYIYGYSPNISLNTDYYCDNYNTYFDIPYTKLSTEAVTVTYVTYDPNDVEVPAFSTKISYPYGNSGATTNTLTSYDVPYTYTYDVAQTNNKFSADSQSYTASGASRTVTFTLYPNNRDFSTVADLEAYQYAWEGMRATVGDTKYKYTNGEWVEQTHSLPDVPFTVNYNAKQYNASTKTLLKTEGQLADVDAVITAGTPTVHDGYLTIASSTRATISGYHNYFNRDNNNPNLTIISKQRTDGSNGHMFANRDSNYNWMYRCYSNRLTLHGTSEQGSVAVTAQPVIESVRVNSSRLATYNNYTNNTSSTYSNFSYGSTNSGKFAIFAGYGTSTGEWFVGDFYWVYMCQGTLTDEQIQEVIDYNENL